MIQFIILIYIFTSLILLTGLADVVSTCSHQPKLIAKVDFFFTIFYINVKFRACSYAVVVFHIRSRDSVGLLHVHTLDGDSLSPWNSHELPKGYKRKPKELQMYNICCNGSIIHMNAL